MTHTIPFRSWLDRTLSLKEEAYIDLLEQQRRSRGYIRAFVNDPEGELTAVAVEYVSWFQTFIDLRDALVFTPLKSPKLPIPRVFQTSARSFRKHQGKPLCIGQALLFGADAYCPSVPLWRNYFDQIFSLTCGYFNSQGTILIVHGNIARRRGRRTPFARRYELFQADDFYAFFDTTKVEQTVEQAFQPATPKPITKSDPKPLFVRKPLAAREIVHPQFQILNFHILPRAAPRAA